MAMASLCIVEDPAHGGAFTRTIAQFAQGDVFERVGYVAAAPLTGLATPHHPPETPVVGYTHFLLVGSPGFIARQPRVDADFSAYVLADSQFIAAEAVDWVPRMARIAVPSVMTGGALRLAYNQPVAYTEVRPWGVPVAPKPIFNRTELRQLLVPAWDHTAPVVLAYAEHADTMCSVLARTKNVNLLLLGDVDAAHQLRLDMCGLEAHRVAFTTSAVAWDAADIYVALNPFTAWPWDVVHAIARQLPVAALKTYVYESFIEDGHVAPINAFDMITQGSRLSYGANSTDIANALAKFLADPVGLHTRVQVASHLMAAHTPEKFTKQLIKALFTA